MCGKPVVLETELAAEWSTKYDYGLRGDIELARVAQYLTHHQPTGFNVKSELTMRRGLSTHPDFLDDIANHYRLLSSLPFRIFIATSSDGFLFEALKADGKTPKEWHFWSREWLNEQRDEIESAFADLTSEAPAVVYLFGHYSDPDSMLVSEDEFLRYIFSIGQDSSFFPTWLPQILSNNMLVILGFQIHDWSFRTISQVFSQYLKSEADIPNHLAVQIAPLKEEFSKEQEQLAKDYLGKYLRKMNCEIFIGEPAEFLGQLTEKFKAHDHG